MQTFVLAQALVEHASLSSISTGFGNAAYDVRTFVEGLNLTYVVIGLAVVVALFVWGRR